MPAAVVTGARQTEYRQDFGTLHCAAIDLEVHIGDLF
jgi:hypothetical protein